MIAPWLSVVMPTYNSERYLRLTFDSLVAQTEGGFECVVIDGGSTDSTREIIDAYSARLDLRLIPWTKPGNWGAQTNTAIEFARSSHVCMLHHDDLWHPNRAREVRLALKRNPDVALVLHPATLIDADGGILGTWTCPLDAEPKRYSPTELIERLLVQNFIALPSATFRRESALEVEGIDPSLWYSGDWDFYLKLAATGESVYLKEALASFRVHRASLTITGSTNAAAFWTQLDTVLDRHLPAISQSRQRRAIVRAARASNAINAALAAAMHGSYDSLLGATLSLAALGPFGWRRYFRDSRIVERLSARVRVLRALRSPITGAG